MKTFLLNISYLMGIRVPGGAFKITPATGQSKINYILRIYAYRLIYIKK